MTVVLQVSDPHFGTERPEVETALRALTDVLAPRLLVVSGDVTQRARRKQFAAARRFIDTLAVPVSLVIPGNHDLPLFNIAARALSPYAEYRRAFGDDLEPSHEAEDLLVLCVNTTRARRHKDGEVSPEQIERVAARLRAASPRQLRIVVTHQPMLVTRLADEQNLLHGYRDAARAWAAAGADLVMGGHIHLPYVRPLDEAVLGLARPVWAVQAGTALSHRVRDGVPNSVNVVRYDAASGASACQVERWDYQAAARRFECHSTTPIPLHRAAHG
ncbi:metallophosphoesterase family protein [Caldimonas brevitalea]|uniref:DNA repair exonuclease n=1 Tax=Caldimonas brevitalea TaxID=413882 RepID=A0A0G3BQP7_9BURK|nr:metallophosphoesterase [Caldimonas brevitalea]AKJ30273.1 DNA repair exonuclease [Caldimonas brevitalea]